MIGLLSAETTALLSGVLLVPAVRRRLRAMHRERSEEVRESAGGWLLRSAGAASLHATGVILAFTVLLSHLYRVALLAPQRLALLVLFSLAALPLVGAVEWWASLLGRERAALGGLLLALGTAGAAPQLFERMAALPVYVFALSLVVLTAYRFGRAREDGAGAAVFGALVCGWATSTVCALY